jgi:acyl carrier protein
MTINIQDVVSAVHEVLLNRGCRTDKLTPNTILRDLEFDSLDLAEILIILEEQAGGEISLSNVTRLERVSDFTRLAVMKDPRGIPEHDSSTN